MVRRRLRDGPPVTSRLANRWLRAWPSRSLLAHAYTGLDPALAR
jgi:hypothetical protein